MQLQRGDRRNGLRRGVWLTLAGLLIGSIQPIAAVAIEPTAAKNGESSVPRYQFEVGQVIVYESWRGFSGRDTRFLDRDTIWVTNKNDDGSHSLVVRHEVWIEQGTEEDGDAPARRTVNETLAYLDLNEDGSFQRNSSFGYQFFPNELFPRLPPNLESISEGWESPPNPFGDRFKFEVADQPDDPRGSWQISAVREGPTNDVYESTDSFVMRFDGDRGLIETIERKWTQEFGSGSEAQGTLSLISVNTVEPDWLRTFRDETSRYFEALARYQELNKRANHEFSRAEELTKESLAVLEGIGDEVTVPIVKESVAAYLKQERRYGEHTVESARKFEALIGQPSEDWELEDLDGNKHKLSELRGRVVLLDFWYRGCGWCVRAMPQIKQVAERFADRPVTVFGMNTDRELENAQFVEKAMTLNYPSLQATGIPEKYEVTTFPTLVILDQHGKIRDIHVGYADDLFEQVSASVERLLEEPATEPAATPVE